MEILRTPDACFENLPDYTFKPNYIEFPHTYGSLRMHYLDEGPKDADYTFFLLHGEPSWSYLYRKMIPPLVARGYRCVAPDLIGFGRSDKLPLRSDYSYQGHVDRIRALIEHLDLNRIISFGQDWGGPITLQQVAAMPDRFAAIIVANTLLPTCEKPPEGIQDWPGEGVLQWIQLSESSEINPGEVLQGVTVNSLSDEEVRAYDAPFPDNSYKAAVAVFPQLIPIHADKPGVRENRLAWKVLEKWDKPCLVAFSDQDPSTAPWREVFLRRIPTAKKFEVPVIAGGGHMLQEDVADELIACIDKFVASF